MNKSSAVNFLSLIIDGSIDEAYDEFVDMNGKHHNVWFPAGFEALKKAMKEDYLNNPSKTFIIKHVIEENNLVAVHSILQTVKQELTVVHLFRFENEKIVEMWDVVNLMPDKMINKDGVI